MSVSSFGHWMCGVTVCVFLWPLDVWCDCLCLPLAIGRWCDCLCLPFTIAIEVTWEDQQRGANGMETTRPPRGTVVLRGLSVPYGALYVLYGVLCVWLH